MRITIVTGFFLPIPPVRGGATEKIWHRLAQEFAAVGHEVTFISRQWEGFPDREVVGGVRHVRVRGADHTRHLWRNLWLDLKWGWRVSRVLPPADITICNTPILPAWLPHVRRSAGRIVAVVARMPKGQSRLYGSVDLLLALSGSVSSALVAENPRLSERIAPFPFPIDWARHARAAASRRATRLPSEPVVIGYIGRVHPEKGLPLLAAAANHLGERTGLPEWRIAIRGQTSVADGGGGEEFARSLCDGLTERVRARVSVDGPEYDVQQLAERFAAVDIFCYPSVAEAGETFGVAVAEAMASGCAPIVSSLECFQELVVPGSTGLVFDHRASNASELLAAQIETLLRDADLRARLGHAAQEHARSYDYSAIATLVLGHFDRLMPTNQTAAPATGVRRS